MPTQTVKGVDHVTFGKFAQSLASNHTSTLRTPLEARRISDNLDSETNIHRAALHCICWVISRIFSNECRNLSWYHIFWSVSSFSALPGFIQQILVLLNRQIFWSVSSSSALPCFLQQIFVLLNRRNKLWLRER